MEPSPDTPPVACSLSAKELQERRETAIRELRKAILETRELPSGVALRFGPDALTGVFEFVSFERRCCAFLTFEVEVQGEEGPVWLRLTGPEGTRELLKGMEPQA